MQTTESYNIDLGQTTESYNIDLGQTTGNGEIKCPKCGSVISPNDKTEDTYRVMKTIMKGDLLEKVVLECRTCGSDIHLTGFELLREPG